MFWFSKERVIQESKNEVYAQWSNEKKLRQEYLDKMNLFELEKHIGKLVICISNEIQNVTVGYGKEIQFITQTKQPMLVVHDIINDCEIMPFGIVFKYTEQKFDALNKLEPNERIAILYNKSSEHYIDKSSSQRDKIIEAELWAEKVKSAIKAWKN